jgi:hypothetical protein
MAGGPVGPFRVINLKAVSLQLRVLHDQAKAQGTDFFFRQSLVEIHRRLATDPLEFGEPLYNLQELNLQVRIGLHPPLSVRFAVDKERKLVYLFSVISLANMGPA